MDGHEGITFAIRACALHAPGYSGTCGFRAASVMDQIDRFENGLLVWLCFGGQIIDYSPVFVEVVWKCNNVSV